MNEELKSCPACGGNRADPAHKHGGQYNVICPDCYMLGPRCKTADAAAAAWNALPRALVWASEPPKVVGWYWVKSGTVCYVSILKYDANDIKYLKRDESTQWAGPVPEPKN